MRKTLLFGFLLFQLNLFAQQELAGRILFYPAGKITMVQYGHAFENGWTWTAEAGYNFARRQDFGLHDKEEGGGPGVGVGLRKYFSKPTYGFYAEVNSQMWWMKIDWSDGILSEGKTEITVFQPTLGAGYAFQSKSEKWAALIGLAFGQEFNIKTDGDPVGEGGISLLTFSISRRL